MLKGRPKRKTLASSPTRTIVLSFLLVILIGAVLLSLPVSLKEGKTLPFVDAVFTATSATCVTGLIVADTYSHFTLFGQSVILALIQIGGLGLVTLTTFFSVLVGRKLGLREAHMAFESVGSEDNFSDTKKTIRFVVLGCLLVEAMGALILCTQFIPKYGDEGIFISIFLAVSSFCNAGFDILGREGAFTNLVSVADNPIIIATIMSLIILGGLGFIVWRDLLNYRKNKRLMLHTKIVLIGTAALLVLGAVLFMIFEYSNDATIGEMSFFEKMWHSLFHSVSTRTAGFNTVDMAALYDETKLLSCFLMFIGAGPGSTAGGVKITTIVIVVMTVFSVLSGKEDTVIKGRLIRKDKVYRALTILALSFAWIIFATLAIFYLNKESHNISLANMLFETVSGFATVGLTAGVTTRLDVISKIILIVTMFIGRVGPVSLGISLVAKNKKANKMMVLPDGKIYL